MSEVNKGRNEVDLGEGRGDTTLISADRKKMAFNIPRLVKSGPRPSLLLDGLRETRVPVPSSLPLHGLTHISKIPLKSQEGWQVPAQGS